MSWNYRLCKTTYKSSIGELETGYDIHEVYYNRDGRIWAVSAEGMSAFGETPDEIRDDLERMRSALDKEIIDLDVIVFVERDKE